MTPSTAAPRYARFRDIPQLTRDSAYACDQSWAYLPEWVDDMVNERGLQLDPDFQRGHVWTPTQQSRYVEFVLRGGKSGRDLYFNYRGFKRGLCADPHATGDDAFVCVDGLQRLTAVLGFLKGEVLAFGARRSDFADRPDFIRHAFRVHINDLETRAEVLTWYREMNGAGTPHSAEELARVDALIAQEQRRAEGRIST